MDAILIVVAFGFVLWSVWVAHYAVTQYPIDKRLDEVTRR